MGKVVELIPARVPTLEPAGAVLWVRWPGVLTGHRYGVSTVRSGFCVWTRVERAADGETVHFRGDVETYAAARRAHEAMPDVAEPPQVSP